MKDIELPPLPERDTSKPAEEQGVFRKFDVRRTDGSSDPGGKHHGCEYFVLDVDHDPAAHAALAAYADAIEATHPVLAADMRSRYGLARAAVEDDRAQRVPDAVCDDDLSELAHSANQEALSFGLNHDVFMRYFKEVRRRLLASTPAPAQQEPVNAVAYLDIGAGGYMDLGTDMSDEVLSQLPKGRHMLVIAGTYGVDGYTAAQHQEPPQQERKRLTGEQASAMAAYFNVPADYVHTVYNRVHGIKE